MAGTPFSFPALSAGVAEDEGRGILFRGAAPP